MATATGLASVRTETNASDQQAIDFSPQFKVLKESFNSHKTYSYAWRIQQLKQLEKMFVDNCDDIIRAIKEDLSRPTDHAFMGDVSSIVSECRFAIDNLKDWMKPSSYPHPWTLSPGKSEVHYQPKGVVLVIGAWNFPFHVTFIPLIGAIAAGCCAIIKPSEVSVASAKLTETLVKKYLDQNCFRVIPGGVPETTALLALPFDHIFYTGNGMVAKTIMEAAAKHLTPVTLELGGKSPVIVDPSANLEVTARRIIGTKFFNTGQVCIAPDYVLCHKDVEAKLLEQLVKNVNATFGPDPEKSSSLGRIINTRHFDRVADLIATSTGQIVTGGLANAKKEARFIPPTIIKNVSPNDKIMQQEIFGPVLPIITVSSVKEAVDFVNKREHPLALYVFAEDKKEISNVVENTTSGGVCVNDCMVHTSNPHLPFGGIGASGLGAHHGKRSFDVFSHEKAVMTRGTWLDPKSRYAPFDESKLPFLKKLFLGPLVPPYVKLLFKATFVVVLAAIAAKTASHFRK